MRYSFDQGVAMSRSQEHCKKVKRAEEELNRRIEETFALTDEEYRSRLFGLIFGLIIVVPIALGTLLCEIYGIVIGSSMILSSISSALRGQASFTYSTAVFHLPPLFHLNLNLSNLFFAWGILLSVIISNQKDGKIVIYRLIAIIFGIINLVIGLINLLEVRVVLSARISGFYGSFVGIFVGLSIVITILRSWKIKDCS